MSPCTGEGQRVFLQSLHAVLEVRPEGQPHICGRVWRHRTVPAEQGRGGKEESHEKEVVTSVGSGADYQGFNSGSTTYKLCDLGQVTHLLWALAFLSVEWG